MSKREDIEQDLAIYFAKEEELSRTDRRDLLRGMFDKHFLLSYGEVLLNKHDLEKIMSDAKGLFAKESAPVTIAGRKLDGSELPSLYLAESTIALLNFKDVLRRKPRFNK